MVPGRPGSERPAGAGWTSPEAAGARQGPASGVTSGLSTTDGKRRGPQAFETRGGPTAPLQRSHGLHLLRGVRAGECCRRLGLAQVTHTPASAPRGRLGRPGRPLTHPFYGDPGACTEPRQALKPPWSTDPPSRSSRPQGGARVGERQRQPIESVESTVRWERLLGSGGMSG